MTDYGNAEMTAIEEVFFSSVKLTCATFIENSVGNDGQRTGTLTSRCRSVALSSVPMLKQGSFS